MSTDRRWHDVDICTLESTTRFVYLHGSRPVPEDETQVRWRYSYQVHTWAEAILRFAYSNRRLAGPLPCDPNPANFRFFPDGAVGFLDFGSVQVLTKDQRRCWFAMVWAAIDGRKTQLRDLMGQAGFLDNDPSLTAEELHWWWERLLGDIMAESQPVTYTAQHRTRVIGGLFNCRDRQMPLARLSFPSGAVATARIQFNLVNICTALSATLPVRAIALCIGSTALAKTSFDAALVLRAGPWFSMLDRVQHPAPDLRAANPTRPEVSIVGDACRPTSTLPADSSETGYTPITPVGD